MLDEPVLVRGGDLMLALVSLFRHGSKFGGKRSSGKINFMGCRARRLRHVSGT